VIEVPVVCKSRSISSKESICIPLGLKLGLELKYPWLISGVSLGGHVRSGLKRSGFGVPGGGTCTGGVDG